MKIKKIKLSSPATGTSSCDTEPDTSDGNTSVSETRKTKRRGFKFSTYAKEDHRKSLFGVAFNPYGNPALPPVFATVGSNRVTLYQCVEGGTLSVLQSYCDPCKDENFYTLCWLYTVTDKDQVEVKLAVAGKRGLIRILSPERLTDLFTLLGSGDSINELKVHPKDKFILLSASKDNSLRLWNLKTRQLIAILGGLQGHRDEVLSCDFDLMGKHVISCGMDHSIKMWSLEGISETVELSYTYQSEKPFPVQSVHFPVFSTRSVHRNYVDCVRWFGKLILSKSCENKIVCWKPELETGQSSTIPEQAEVLHSFEYGNCHIWYMRFALSFNYDTMAAGNQSGKVFVWDLLNEDEPSKQSTLTHQKCSSPVRQVCFSPDGTTLVAVADDATVWRWDKN